MKDNNYNNVLTINRSRSSFLWAVIPMSLMIIFINYAISVLISNSISEYETIKFIVLGIILLIGQLYFLIPAFKKGLYYIYPDKIVSKHLFKKTELSFNNITGFRTVIENGEYLKLIPKDNPEKPLSISLTIIENPEKIREWVKTNFTDLDKLDYDKELARVEADLSLGVNKDERLLRISQAKQLGKVLNVTSIVLSLWTLFYPHPYELLLIILLFFPFLIILFMKHYHGLIKIDSDNKAHADVGLATFFPEMALAIRGLMDWHILIMLDLLLPVLIISIGTFILYYFQLMASSKKLKYLLLLYFPFIFYGLGATIVLNGIFVKSAPSNYEAIIIEKRIGGKENNNHYFDLDSFAEFKNPNEIKVSEESYNKYNVSDSYPIKVQVGTLGIPWYIQE